MSNKILFFLELGRILTKFGETKLFALTEVGIHNLLTLFLILASVVGTKETVSFILGTYL